MDNTRQSGYEENFRSESDRRANLIDRLEQDRGSRGGRDIPEIVEHTLKQAKKKELHCVTYTTTIIAANIPIIGPVIFPLGIHLPEEAFIGSLYLENHSTSGINVFEGSGGGGRLIGYGTGNSYRVIAFADNISNCSLVVDTSKTLGDGLVIATLFTHHWAPKMGTIV